MVKTNGHGLEALAVRRATMTDSDKVRYRVYTSPTEYIAVIAESALMAMRVSGVAEPQRIVRDLPTEGVAIAAERMEAGDSGQRVNLATEKAIKEPIVMAPVPTRNAEPQDGNFIPLKLGDLDQKQGRNMRILTAKDWADMAMPQAAAAVAAAPEPIMAPVTETPASSMSEPAASDELSPDEVQALLNK